MKNRCSPEALLSIILGMSKEQKESVRSMGFGALLKMKITDIPLKLGFYVLQKFDSERMLIDFEGKELKVTAESVHDMLGIPIGEPSLHNWINGLRMIQLFYADNIHSEALTVTRKRPTICYWSSEKIRYRETFEQEKGRFRVGELNEEFVNEQNEGDTDLEDSDSDKDEDHSVEAYESKISKMINSFERMKEKLNSKLNDVMKNFPEKESFRIFKEKMKNMIVEEKTEKGEIGVKEKDGKRNENQNDEEEKDDNAEETNNHEETIQQTENQNLLDKVVDNVLGIGVSSLNSQEDEIWNHPEKKRSPMSTGKTNTLAEKEKSEGVHEQGTKVEKTKGDDTGKENSEDRNEGGTEAKNTKDGGEEKQTKIEKGNAEDRGKKKSENQNKKGEKADKTKGNKGDTHPSFSLGLSQNSDQTSSKKSNESSPKKALTKKQIKDDLQKVVIRLAKKNVLNPNPISVSIPTEVGPSKHDLDQPREKKLADAFKSPFKCRITDTKAKLTHQESIVCEWLFNLQGNTSDVVVQKKYGQIAERVVMESLYASMEIFGEVLDTWSDLLNHQELERDFGNSPYRHFLKVGVSTAYLTSTLSDERKYEKFMENFHDSTNGYKEILNIKDIDMKSSIEILDNSAVEGDYERKHRVIMKPLSKCSLKKSIKPQRLEMSWRTVKNKVDCGVFAMRHMETYMGQPLSKWKPGLHKESAVQQTTLEKLRQKYA
uniref:Ubiquitin-like protease family profile domain-containing protein n=1 Tax=Lactuca sativa TaxID=4236 RepID=A0A9R1W1P1_LACSA|nr:hypothetical protein LSAT_V11C300121420 [Lactuca sativa]